MYKDKDTMENNVAQVQSEDKNDLKIVTPLGTYVMTYA